MKRLEWRFLGYWEVKALLGVLEVEVGEEVGVDSR